MSYTDAARGENNVPNLDAMEPDDLMAFWKQHQAGRNSRALFLAGGTGTHNATADLANYASSKATAMQCRLRGDVESALMYEKICDGIYDRLPDWARSW